VTYYWQFQVLIYRCLPNTLHQPLCQIPFIWTRKRVPWITSIFFLVCLPSLGGCQCLTQCFTSQTWVSPSPMFFSVHKVLILRALPLLHPCLPLGSWTWILGSGGSWCLDGTYLTLSTAISMSEEGSEERRIVLSVTPTPVWTSVGLSSRPLPLVPPWARSLVHSSRHFGVWLINLQIPCWRTACISNDHSYHSHLHFWHCHSGVQWKLGDGNRWWMWWQHLAISDYLLECEIQYLFCSMSSMVYNVSYETTPIHIPCCSCCKLHWLL
jgi:hypothetical protein